MSKKDPALAQERRMPSASRPSSARKLLAPLGSLVTGAALTADIIAGSTVPADPRLGFALHVPAVLFWTLGLALVALATPAGWATRGRALSLGAIALVLFPGLGSLACILALIASRLSSGLRPQSSLAEQPEAIPEDGVEYSFSPVAGASDWLADLDVEPLDDLMRDRDPLSRRAAIEALRRRRGYEAVGELRVLLADPDPDVRTFAAVAISELENDFGKELVSVNGRVDESPELARHHAELSGLLYRYACAGPLDDAGRKIFLLRARERIAEAIELDPGLGDAWLGLSRIDLELGHRALAWDAVNRALAESPGNPDGCLLAMQLALDGRRLDQLPALAAQACAFPIEDRETEELLHWWAAVDSSARRPAA
jgi:hypothetical protein